MRELRQQGVDKSVGLPDSGLVVLSERVEIACLSFLQRRSFSSGARDPKGDIRGTISGLPEICSAVSRRPPSHS
jgi:hypothetical protein